MRKSLLAATTALALFACSDPGGPGGPDYSVAPAAPTGFGVNGISATCVELRWDDVSDNERGFILQRATDSDFVDRIEIEIPAGVVRYRDYDSPGATRYYRALAWNEAGRSDTSDHLAAFPPEPTAPPPPRTADHRVADLIRRGKIPTAAILAAKSNLRIAYGHTSHGSQIVSGMNGLVAFADAGNCDGDVSYKDAPGLFSWSHEWGNGALMMTEDMGGYDSLYDAYDLNNPSYSAWESATSNYLAEHPEINVVMWSWCGGVSGAEEATIDGYLARMTGLERDFPYVTFVYMTGHSDGTGTGGNLAARNKQIRDYCRNNNKWLFDFNDIETYDPDGIGYASLFTDDACAYDFNRSGGLDAGDRNWAVDWQAEHEAGVDWFDCGAAHSYSIVANMKAYAVWWLWCEIAKSLGG
jgi:hypothetical protein